MGPVLLAVAAVTAIALMVGLLILEVVEHVTTMIGG